MRIQKIEKDYAKSIKQFNALSIPVDDAMGQTLQDMKRGGGDLLHINLERALTTEDQHKIKKTYDHAVIKTRLDEKFINVHPKIRDYLKINCNQKGALYASSYAASKTVCTLYPARGIKSEPLRIDIIIHDANSVTLVERYSINNPPTITKLPDGTYKVDINPVAIITTTSNVRINAENQLTHTLEDDKVYLLDENEKDLFKDENVIDRTLIDLTDVNKELDLELQSISYRLSNENQNDSQPEESVIQLTADEHLEFVKDANEALNEANLSEDEISSLQFKGHLHLGFYYYKNNNINKGESHLLQASVKSPSNIDVNIGLAQIYFKKNRFDTAVKYCDRALNEMDYSEKNHSQRGPVDQQKQDALSVISLSRTAHDCVTNIKFKIAISHYRTLEPLISSTTNASQISRLINYIDVRNQQMEREGDIYNFFRKKFGFGAKVKMIAASKVIQLLNGEKVRNGEKVSFTQHEFEALTQKDSNLKIIYDSLNPTIKNEIKHNIIKSIKKPSPKIHYHGWIR